VTNDSKAQDIIDTGTVAGLLHSSAVQKHTVEVPPFPFDVTQLSLLGLVSYPQVLATMPVTASLVVSAIK